MYGSPPAVMIRPPFEKRAKSRWALDLGSVAHVDMTYLNHEQRRHGLDDAELADPR